MTVRPPDPDGRGSEAALGREANQRPAGSDGMGEPPQGGTACRDTLKSEHSSPANGSEAILRRTLRAVNDNALGWHAGEDGKARALNVIAVWTNEALAGRLHPSVELLTEESEAPESAPYDPIAEGILNAWAEEAERA